jgi:predicted transcriptional regulator
MRATSIAALKESRDDGSIVEIVIWQVPEAVPPSTHAYKYRLYYGKDGISRVRYDNERGKGDHKHVREVEEEYVFETLEKLLADFRSDVQNWSWTMKAIIEVAKRGSIFAAAAEQIAASRRGKAPDYRLSFESARSLFSELTPARLDLMDTLRRMGPCSVNALAKAADRNYSNVHTDVGRLEELGLIARSDDGGVSVPYESVEILFPLAQVA